MSEEGWRTVSLEREGKSGGASSRKLPLGFRKAFVQVVRDHRAIIRYTFIYISCIRKGTFLNYIDHNLPHITAL